MGTAATPSHVAIYLDKFETMYMYSEIKNDSFFDTKYIDDILVTYKGGKAKLNNPLNNRNIIHNSINFEYEKST